MYQQRVKLHQISTVALGLSCIIATIALIKSILILILIVNYCIAISLICDGLIFQLSLKRLAGIRLLLLGILLIFMTTFLFFKYLKS